MSVERVTTRPGDLLDADYINSLGQLFLFSGNGWDWPVHDFEVETGLFRIDVMGMLDVMHVGSVWRFRTAGGTVVDVGDLYCDPESWETRK